jgi:hypothetical protein
MKKIHLDWMWKYKPTIAALGILKWEDHVFQDSLGPILSSRIAWAM